MSRRAELRADEHAAGLGFAQHLMTVLRKDYEREESERATAAALGTPFAKEGVTARLLASHPDVCTRLHHLQGHLENRH
ncbi:hypothetical protein GCM10010358_52830 [Streptomyces minutiscleroticus]|uniref:Peptidase M48 domain-containing protein n=1 Tax=Streptomyces minutiscleroticus TaxID=68238 RepID=A0A918NSI4_9ACTN|nr:M48 family metalloprotease [Streptomyces minutiscleroticus]GGX92360.1 hypothetical protein GCM10010358_52830 [Streptomyces minutiscleroticus]